MKHFIIRIAVYFLFISALVCTGKSFAAPKHAPEAGNISGQWKLLPVLASDTETGKIPILNFDVSGGSFTGNTGCNNFSGKIILNGDKLSFSEQSVLTQNDCQGYNEDVFMANLIKVNHYEIKDGVLQLMIDGTVLSKWVIKEPANTVKKV